MHVNKWYNIDLTIIYNWNKMITHMLQNEKTCYNFDVSSAGSFFWYHASP